METKDFKFRLEDVDEEKGTFSGFASVFDELDSYNEIVMKGAFKKTLQENDGKFPLCWFHRVDEPLGIIKAEEGKRGLDANGILNLDVQSAREKRSLMKQEVITGLSIGFKTIKDEWDDKVRKLKEIQLFEISLITRNFQACPSAEIVDVKAEMMGQPQTFEEILERIMSIEVIENLSEERYELIKKAKTHIDTLLTEGEPLRIGTLGPMVEPSLDGLSKELKALQNLLGG